MLYAHTRNTVDIWLWERKTGLGKCLKVVLYCMFAVKKLAFVAPEVCS